jgi:hypothetical protein
MTKIQTPNYSDVQVAIIRAFTPTGKDGAFNQADCAAIAAMPEMNDADGNPRKSRSIVAKVKTLGLPYEKKAVVRKDGTKVQSKADLVAEIAKMAGVTFDALTNAGREDLVKLRDFVSEVTSEAA